MKKFLDDNFVLENKTAQTLYHEYAKQMPIIDYHCHLPPADIANDRQFKTISEIWLAGDHYKWRAMRTNGVDERYCTGDASDEEKFMKWAETVPSTMRNPLYHWTHMELKRPFGIEKVLNASTAKEIYEETNKKLQQKAFSARGILKQMNVEVVCSTDDPIDSLEHHIKIKNDSTAEVKVLPTFRPDKAMAVSDPTTYNQYVDKLAEVAGMDINTYQDLIGAVQKRHDFFAEVGCKLSDHGIETFYAEDYTQQEVDQIFAKIRSGKALSKEEQLKFMSCIMVDFALMDHEKGWTQQFHFGALRNNNSRMMKKLGPDTGFDSIGDWNHAVPMSKFLDRLDSQDKLTKTILYNLNPADYDVVGTMIGNFQDGSYPGKMQFGSGWWFNDQKDGMERQMDALSNLGLLSRFVGMLTDSRSFLSYPRHEYFRRILCNLLGKDVENGELPDDMDSLGQMVQNICYYNAKNFFNF